MPDEPLAVSLPWPPSGNHLHRTGRGRRYSTDRYLAWRAAAILAMHAAGLRVGGRYAARLLVHPPDRCRRDLDNVAKPVGDALQHAGAVADDCLCDDLRPTRCDVRKGGEVIVRLVDLDRPARARDQLERLDAERTAILFDRIRPTPVTRGQDACATATDSGGAF